MKVHLSLTLTEDTAIKGIAARYLKEMVDAVELKDGKLDAPSQHDLERAAIDLVGEVLRAIGVKANG